MPVPNWIFPVYFVVMVLLIPYFSAYSRSCYGYMDMDQRQCASAGVKLPSPVAGGDGRCFDWQGPGTGLKDCNNGLIT